MIEIAAILAVSAGITWWTHRIGTKKLGTTIMFDCTTCQEPRAVPIERCSLSRATTDSGARAYAVCQDPRCATTLVSDALGKPMVGALLHYGIQDADELTAELAAELNDPDLPWS